jgi:hypothetical protein
MEQSRLAPEVNFILGFGLGLRSRGEGADGDLFECWDWVGFSFGSFSWFWLGAFGFRFLVWWLRVDGDHYGIASFFEGFHRGFEGGEGVEKIGFV